MRASIFPLLLLFVSTSFANIQAHRSIQVLPSSNGWCSLAYNLNSRVMEAFFPHISDVWDVDITTPNLINKAGFKLIFDNTIRDLDEFPITHIEYINGTGIIRIDYELEEFSLQSFIWAPMILDFKVAIMLLHFPTEQSLKLSPKEIGIYAEPLPPFLEQVRIEYLEEDGFWVGQALAFVEGLDMETKLQLLRELEFSNPRLLLEAEERRWMHWHRLADVPVDITGSTYEMLCQSAAFIKMAQCKEPGKSYGQIVDNLSPYHKSVASPRDMAYAIIALSRMGKYLEAKAALEFMLQGDGGSYFSPNNETAESWMKSPYIISLSHYSGMGQELVDTRNSRPLLYLDGQGLFLWACTEYFRKSSDVHFVAKYFSQIKNYVIAPLIQSIDETGLIRKDSGFWHSPSSDEHYMYTSISAYQGLISAALLAKAAGQDKQAILYTKTACDLKSNILYNLTIGRSLLLAKSLETQIFPFCLDASAVEAINWNVVEPYWRTAKTTQKSLQVFLNAGPNRGHSMGFDTAEQLLPENTFVTLRTIEAQYKLSAKEQADTLLSWITEQTSHNGGMIPEYYTLDTADYLGAYPQIGLGAGAYILSILRN